MKNFSVWIFIALFLLFVLSGCCTNMTTDPSKGGLMGGVCGVTTGSYDQRITEREARLANFRGESASAESERERLKQTEAQASRDVTAMRGRVNTLRTEISAMSADTSEKQRQKQDLMRRASALDAQLQQLQRQNPDQTANYHQRKADLEREIQQLYSIANR